MSEAALPPPRTSRGWSLLFRIGYAALRVLDPLIHLGWRAGWLGVTVRLETTGRRSGRRRSVLVGLIRVAERWYVLHPNGPAYWTRNLAAAGKGHVVVRGEPPLGVRAVPLAAGEERDAVIVASAAQQPFPGSLAYGAARAHLRAVAVVFRLEPISRSP